MDCLVSLYLQLIFGRCYLVRRVHHVATTCHQLRTAALEWLNSSLLCRLLSGRQDSAPRGHLDVRFLLLSKDLSNVS